MYGDIFYINRSFTYDYFRKNISKKTEDFADKIHPTVGKLVKAKHNLDDTFDNAVDSKIFGFNRELFSSEVTELSMADHLFVQRIGYTHHGLYIGNGRVIHYLADCVSEDTLETFADGAKIHKKTNNQSPLRYSKDEVINRAYRRLNEDKYNLLINNCESFVRWCRGGGDQY